MHAPKTLIVNPTSSLKIDLHVWYFNPLITPFFQKGFSPTKHWRAPSNAPQRVNGTPRHVHAPAYPQKITKCPPVTSSRRSTAWTELALQLFLVWEDIQLDPSRRGYCSSYPACLITTMDMSNSRNFSCLHYRHRVHGGQLQLARKVIPCHRQHFHPTAAVSIALFVIIFAKTTAMLITIAHHRHNFWSFILRP